MAFNGTKKYPNKEIDNYLSSIGLELGSDYNASTGYETTKYKLTIIGVGGIYDHKTMIDKFNAGASLVQIYTGWIYEGPGLIKKMNKIMVNELSKN